MGKDNYYKGINIKWNLDGYPQGRNDQLAMILSTLGKPTNQEM